MSACRAANAPLFALLLLLATSTACRREQPVPAAAPGDDLQTVEVAPPPDALVDIDTDVRERRRAEAFSGVLPSGFPRELPLPAGASLVDQGPRWVELLVGRRLAEVRPQYLRQLAAAKWSVAAEGDRHRLSRGGQSVRLSLAAAGPSTRLRLEY